MSQEDIPEELKDLQSSVALGLLQDLVKQKKLSVEAGEEWKKKFSLIHDTLVKTFNNHRVLYSKAKKLKNDLNLEKHKLEQATAHQIEQQEKAENSNTQLKQAEAELDIQEHRVDVLTFEMEDLEHEKMNKEMKIQEEEKESKLRIQPDIERFNVEIEHYREEIQKRRNTMDVELRHKNDQAELRFTLSNENEEILKETTTMQDELVKIREDPVRFAKNADMLQNAIKLMENDFKGINEENEKKDKIISEHESKLQHLSGIEREYEKQIQGFVEESKRFSDIIQSSKAEVEGLIFEKANLEEERLKLETESKVVFRESRRLADEKTKREKEIDQINVLISKEEQQKKTLTTQIIELETIKENLRKEEEKLKFEIEKEVESQTIIEEDLTLIEGKRRMVVEDTHEKETKKNAISKNISELEKQILELQGIEVNALKTIKNLTAAREAMARKASAARNEVRETREELKIKELMILDLRKKYQETEFKLNQFKTLYDEVKSTRNKCVNLIQSYSQDLAELKERIKIYQNELEILKNESLEKDKTLVELKHVLQLEIQRRDRRHTKLNKLEYTRKAKKELVDQSINEIQKLNMILNSLEKDMLELRHKYEQGCESRNFTGIQLIDRNDELCILYEKLNIQENILKNGEGEVKRIEDDIRLLILEIAEEQRKIDVSRKQLERVPIFADRIVAIKNDLDAEKERELKLSEELENPENENRWRDLKSEDPDIEALEAKIQVLEERLNAKKETLLEKELVFEEISNLSEKLRKQAIDNRQTTLELSERLNDFQTRLKDITRKMMATISELSMLQATSLKLENERSELEKVVSDSKERSEQSLPPQPEHEIEFLKMYRDQRKFREDLKRRKEIETFEKSIPPFATKTTAKRRFDVYLSDGLKELNVPNDGLPRPYGKFQPFEKSDVGVQIRHIRKPNPTEIKI